MKAKITAADGYRCAPEGHTVVTFPMGEIVTGHVAEWAVADKAASRMFDKAEPLEDKAVAPKATKGRRKAS